MAALPITSATYDAGSGDATITTAEALPAGSAFQIVVAGAPGFNGTYSATSTGTDTLTYPLSSPPAADATGGTVTILRAQPIAVLDANASASGLSIAFNDGLVVVPGACQKCSVAIIPGAAARIVL